MRIFRNNGTYKLDICISMYGNWASWARVIIQVLPAFLKQGLPLCYYTIFWRMNTINCFKFISNSYCWYSEQGTSCMLYIQFFSILNFFHKVLIINIAITFECNKQNLKIHKSKCAKLIALWNGAYMTLYFVSNLSKNKEFYELTWQPKL